MANYFHAILVECEENSKYQYKLVIYDNTFDDNPLEKVYAIGNIDYNKTDGNKIANFIIKLEENNYDSKKVFRQLLRDYTKQFELILRQYNIKSKRFNDIGRNSVKDGIVNEGHSNGTRTNQEIGQELSAGVKENITELTEVQNGSRLVEVNNKLIILVGTFKNPEIYSVLVLNANNETKAEFIKDDFYYDFNRCKRFREVVTNLCKSIEIMRGEEFVRFYDSIDYTYKKRRGWNWIPATLPSNFKDYGYTEGRNERYGSSFRTGKSVSSVQLNEETDNNTDEKSGVIHDTLKYEEYDDWLVNDDGESNINDLIKEAVALETTGKIGFYYLDKKRTQSIFKRSGYQLPSQLKNNVNKKSIILLKANNLSDSFGIGKIALQKQVKR